MVGGRPQHYSQDFGMITIIIVSVRYSNTVYFVMAPTICIFFVLECPTLFMGTKILNNFLRNMSNKMYEMCPEKSREICPITL